jgi:hypothetical protein
MKYYRLASPHPRALFSRNDSQKGLFRMVTTPNPPVRFLRASPGGPVPFEPQFLDSCIPTENPVQSGFRSAGCPYRIYLIRIREFIIRANRVLDDIVKARGLMGPVQSLDIISEKHGSDYHPARIVVHSAGSVFSLVVNVAITDKGKRRLKEDFRLLGHLRGKYGTDFIPHEYIMKEQASCDQDDHGPPMLMFLAEWFEGHHEFHLSAGDGNEGQQVILWDMDRGYAPLGEDEAREVFRQAAFILTSFYDTRTFEEIYPWHHASGDFVVGSAGGKIDVRLITVRQYAPRPVFTEQSEDNRILALELFFTNLTVRMRLDRLDGVGDIAWADDRCVGATIQGFVDGMAQKISAGECDPELFVRFLRTMQSLSASDLAELFHAVFDSYDPAAPDTPVVREHLVNHVLEVYRALREILCRVG